MLKQQWTAHDWEWFIPPIYCEIEAGLLCCFPHYLQSSVHRNRVKQKAIQLVSFQILSFLYAYHIFQPVQSITFPAKRPGIWANSMAMKQIFRNFSGSSVPNGRSLKSLSWMPISPFTLLWHCAAVFHAASEIHVDLPGRGRAQGAGENPWPRWITYTGPHGLRVQMSFSRGFEVWQELLCWEDVH